MMTTVMTVMMNDDGDDNDKSSDDDDGDYGDHEDDGEYDDNSRPQSQLLNPLLYKISECLDCEISDRM
jgi:hypothetical protein